MIIPFEWQPRLIICYMMLMILGVSCTGQGQSEYDEKMRNKDNAPSAESKVDTSFRLKFTTGVRSILEDSKGNFWFGSHREGVCLFDGAQLTYFTVEDGLSDNQVRSIFEGPDGNIWFEGGEGISKYDGNKITTVTKRDYSRKAEWEIGLNDLWFKGDEEAGFNEMEGQPGAYRYDGKTLIYQAFPIEMKEGEESYYSVSAPVVRGKNGRVWLGTYGAVIGYDGESFTIINNAYLGLNEETGFLHVRNVFEDSKGNLWIGNNGIGVLKFDGDSTINFSKLHGLVPEISFHGGGESPPGSLEHVFSIGEDNLGNIWFGDRDTGAWRYDGKSLKNYTVKDGLSANHIWQIYKSPKEGLLFAMGDGSVCKFNGVSFERVF